MKLLRTSLPTAIAVAIAGLFTLFLSLTILLAAPTMQLGSSPSIYWHIGVIGVVGLTAYISQRAACLLGTFHRRLALATVIALALLLRLFFISIVTVIPVSDFDLYQSIASQFSRVTHDASDYIALFPHVISYPAILAPIYAVFGAHVLVAQLLNVLLGSSSILLVYCVGRLLHSRRCGFLSAAFYALWPSHIAYSVLVSTEIVFTFLMLVCVLLFGLIVTQTNASSRCRMFTFCLLGSLLRIANAIRPFGLILIIAVTVYYVLFVNEPGALIRRTLLVCTVTLSYMAMGQVVNYGITAAIGQRPVTAPVGFNLYVGTNSDSGGTWNPDDARALRDLLSNPENTAQSIQDKLLAMAIDRIRSHSLLQTARLLLDKHRAMWLGDSDIVNYILAGADTQHPSYVNVREHKDSIRTVMNTYYYVMLSLSMICGAIVLARQDTGYIILCFLVILGTVMVHVFVEVGGRYHYPMMPLLAIIAAYGIVRCGPQALSEPRKS
jgi:4-amino-4-deoxy-L-arabinose transferase-like glycosyltransferase